MTEYIVAEVSKNWPEQEPGTLAERFEVVIEVNRRRGYKLHSFDVSRTVCEPGQLNETIIAVFRVEAAQ